MVRRKGVADALRILADGGEIDYEGASGSMDWDENGDLRRGHIGIWRFTGDERIEEVRAVAFENHSRRFGRRRRTGRFDRRFPFGGRRRHPNAASLGRASAASSRPVRRSRGRSAGSLAGRGGDRFDT